jgi:hypothetical protein
VVLVLTAGFAGWQVYRADQTYKYGSTRAEMLEIGVLLQKRHRASGRFGRPLALRDLANGASVVDAWGEALLLETDEHSFVLTSLGSDRKAGGTGSAEDIVVRWKDGDKELSVRSAPLSP